MTSTRTFLTTLALLAILPLSADAQPAAAPLDAFVEQRVVEELAADGLVLSRLGVTLDVEVIGDRLLISLIESATGRVSASTKLDAVPADREAAVASVTPLVADLVGQLASVATVRPVPAPAERPAPPPVVDDTKAREAAEFEFRQNALGFGNELIVLSTSTTVSAFTRWTAHRGELKEPLAGAEFYRVIGRPDLEAKYLARQRRMRALTWTGLGLLGGALVFAAGAASTEDGTQDLMSTGVLLTAVASGVTLGIAMGMELRPHPIGEGEAKRLAAEYNRTLRARLGLPVHTSLRVGPYATTRGGGLALGGRF